MKFSIISAAHNEERYLAAMIESVIRQSYEHWELLIVDDRSEDGTSAIAHEYASRDPRVVRVDNTGVSGKNSAWNRGFLASDGDVVVYMGADDLMPVRALDIRRLALDGVDFKREKVGVYSKVRMFSEDSRFNGVEVPRGPRGSRAGGTTALTRPMAELVFPLDTTLPNEDLWTSTIVELLGDRTIDAPQVVVDYRVHAGNSFRRDQSFAQANEAYHQRGLVYQRLLECERLTLSQAARSELEFRRELETMRHGGQLLRLLSARRAPMGQRLRLASQASPATYAIRQRFYGFFSGW